MTKREMRATQQKKSQISWALTEINHMIHMYLPHIIPRTSFLEISSAKSFMFLLVDLVKMAQTTGKNGKRYRGAIKKVYEVIQCLAVGLLLCFVWGRQPLVIGQSRQIKMLNAPRIFFLLILKKKELGGGGSFSLLVDEVKPIPWFTLLFFCIACQLRKKS